MTSVALPTIYLTVQTPSETEEIDLLELNELLSDYLLEHLHLELPFRYQLRDIDLFTDYLVANETVREYIVTGTVDVVNDVANDDGIDFQELDKSIVSTLTSLFEEQHSDSATSFLVSLQYAKDNALGMAIDVELSLTKAVEKQLPVANALVQDDVVSDKSFTDSLYFFIACGGFGAVILLIGFLIHSTRSKAKEKAIEQKVRSAKSTNRKKFTNRSSNNNRVDDDHDHPALEYLDNACSSLMSVVDDNKSGGSVDTQDLLGQCDLISVCTGSESLTPKHRPYPYTATEASTPAKSSVSAQGEEWVCVDGVVKKAGRKK